MDLDSVIKPRDFGIVGDGVTDNADNLIAMRDFMLRDTARRYVVEFSPGEYLYSNNRWLRGVKHITVLGNGAKFKCTASKTYSRDEGPLLLPNLFEDYGDTNFEVPNDNGATISGYRIDAALSGSKTVKTSESSEAGFFKPGGWLCVSGFIHQFDNGKPQNLRFFEYHIIQAVDPSGVITLAGRLKFDYKDNWYDYQASWHQAGLPRIVPLDKVFSCQTIDLTIKDAEFLINPNSTLPENFLSLAALNITLDNVTGDLSFSVTSSDSVRIFNSRFDYVEVDKLINNVLIENTHISENASGGTGAYNVELKNCDIDGFTRISPLHSYNVINCNINNYDQLGQAAVVHYYGVATTRLVKVQQCAVINSPKITDGGRDVMTVNEVDGDGNILLQDDAEGRLIIRKVQIGTAIYEDLQYTNFIGRITDMYYENDRHVLDGDFPGVTVGQQVFYKQWHKVVEEDNFFNKAIQ